MIERISWMYNLSRLDPSYISEVHRFIVVATNHAWKTKTKHIYCPCMDCKNVVVFDDTELCVINTTLPPPNRSCSSQPTSIGGDFGGPDFTKYKGEGFGLLFLEEGG
jgi:hypothetical protein